MLSKWRLKTPNWREGVMDVIVDDHLLLQMLLDNEPLGLRVPGARIFTPGSGIGNRDRRLENGSAPGGDA